MGDQMKEVDRRLENRPIIDCERCAGVDPDCSCQEQTGRFIDYSFLADDVITGQGIDGLVRTPGNYMKDEAE